MLKRKTICYHSHTRILQHLTSLAAGPELSYSLANPKVGF